MRSILPFSENERKGWFSPALFRKNFARFWPLVVFYGAIQFFSVPMPIWNYYPYRTVDDVQEVLLASASFSVVMGVAFGLLTAMALFSYLMNNRSAGMIHALPVRREGLFLTNWVTGLCFFALPNTLVMGISLAVQIPFGTVAWGLTLRCFALHTVIGMFFFCFAVCCAMFTGHILALPVFYGVLNGLVVGLYVLVVNTMNELLVGFAGDGGRLENWIRWATPAWHLTEKVQDVEWSLAGGYETAEGTAIAIGYSLVLGAVFTLIAVLVYQKRQLERAGDVVTVSWVRPVFQHGVGVCTGLALGAGLYYGFFDSWGLWGFIGLVTGCSVLGGFIARMFLKKSLRVFADGWKSCCGLGLVAFLLLTGAKADWFGYQKWTPKPEKVEQITLKTHSTPYDEGSGVNITLTDPEIIREVVEFHEELVKDLPKLREGVEFLYEDGYRVADTQFVVLNYTMADGTVVARNYSEVPITEEDLKTEGSYAARLEGLLNRPEVVENLYLNGLEQYEEYEPVGAYLTSTKEDDVDLSYTQACQLWQAFEEDLAAGRIHRYLLDGGEREKNCYYTDVVFSVQAVRQNGTGDRHTGVGMRVTVQKTASAMMEVLEELGLTEMLWARND